MLRVMRPRWLVLLSLLAGPTVRADGSPAAKDVPRAVLEGERRLRLEGPPAPATERAPAKFPPDAQILTTGPAPGLLGACGTMVGVAPGFAVMGAAYRAFWMGVLAAAVPHPGVRLERGGRAAGVLAWQLTYGLPVTPVRAEVLPLGCGNEIRDEFRSHRVVLEPGIVWSRHAELYVRPGYRFLWHVGRSPFAVGTGIGSTVSLTGDDSTRASVAPELLLEYGRCCAPGYGLLTVRWDRYLSGGTRDAFLVAFGLAY
jgi:hypothetical protein